MIGKIILLSVVGLLSIKLKAQTITTVAGNGSSSYNGDGLPATNAAIGFPGGITFNRNGDYFFTEFNNTIRKVSGSGIITTIAGDGSSGFAGDAGHATLAKFNGPSFIAIDPNGDIFVGDYYNNRIRKIDATTGIITTIAGNGTGGYGGDGLVATSAAIYGPQGIVFDKSGNLFFIDYLNNRIRKIDLSGIITTVAGNGVAGYAGNGVNATSSPIWPNMGLAIDTGGNIIFAEGYRVRKIEMSSGLLNTICGDGTIGDAVDGSLATTARVGILYGVCVDGQNNIYIADKDNNKIRKITVSGILYTIAGIGIAGFSGDNGNATGAQLNSPRGITFDTCYNLFVADNANHRIRKVTFNPSCLPISVPDIKTAITSINIQPNPANNELTITAPQEIKSVRVVDMMGRETSPSLSEGEVNSNERSVRIDVSHLPAGVYVVRVNGVYFRKFVKE